MESTIEERLTKAENISKEFCESLNQWPELLHDLLKDYHEAITYNNDAIAKNIIKDILNYKKSNIATFTGVQALYTLIDDTLNKIENELQLLIEED